MFGNSKSSVRTIKGLLLPLSCCILFFLAAWGFHLNSFSRFLIFILPSTLASWLILNFSLYRRHHPGFNSPGLMTAMNGFSALLMTFHLVPPQLTNLRSAAVILLTSGSIFIIVQVFISSIKIIPNKKQVDLALAMVLVFMLSNIAIILYNTQFIRIYGDDFANVVKLERYGLWKSALLFYQNWSGRFFSNFLVMAFSNKPIAPLFFLTGIQFSFFIALSAIFGRNQIIQKIAASSLIPLTIYTVTPDLYKSLYWNGTAMYLLPILLLAPIYLLLAYTLNGEQEWKPGCILLGAFLSFAITTCNESAAVGWLGMHLAGLLWLWITKSNKKNLKGFLVAGFIFSLIGIVVMVAAPGVSARYNEQGYSTTTDLPKIIIQSMQFFLNFLLDIFKPIYKYHGYFRPGWLFLISLFGFGWLTSSPFKRTTVAAVLVLAVSLAMTYGAFIPGAVILGETIPYRTQFIPAAYLTSGLFFFGLLLPHPAKGFASEKLGFIIMVMLILGLMINFNQLFLTIAPMRQFARDWDARDEMVREIHALPRRLNVPWDEYEQNLGDFRKYYRTR